MVFLSLKRLRLPGGMIRLGHLISRCSSLCSLRPNDRDCMIQRCIPLLLEKWVLKKGSPSGEGEWKLRPPAHYGQENKMVHDTIPGQYPVISHAIAVLQIVTDS